MLFFDTALLRLIKSCIFISGHRGRQEARQMRWGDISIEEDDQGKYLQFRERATKTRTGETEDTRDFIPKAYENLENPARCPVRLFKLYKEKRPAAMARKESPFYLAVNNMATNFDIHKWYKNAPLGKNKLGMLLRHITSEGELKGRFTNHTARKTGITNLLHAGVAPTLIAQFSGHKNIDSLKNYATASTSQQREMANILANPGRIVAPIAHNEPQRIPSECISHPRSGDIPKENASVISKNNASMISGLFSGANMSGCTFNFKILTKNN